MAQTRLRLVIAAVVGLVVLVVVGLVVTRIGGASIRSASQTYEVARIVVPGGALLPGVPMEVRVTLAATDEARPEAALWLRGIGGDRLLREVGASELNAGMIEAGLPCDVRGEAGVRLLLTERVTRAVLAQSDEVRLLAPGPDCLLK